MERKVLRSQGKDRGARRGLVREKEVESLTIPEEDLIEPKTELDYLRILTQLTLGYYALFPQPNSQIDHFKSITGITLQQNIPLDSVVLLDIEVPWGLEFKVWKVAVDAADQPPFEAEMVKSIHMEIDGHNVKPEWKGELVGDAQFPFELPWIPSSWTAQRRIRVVASFLQTTSPANIVTSILSYITLYSQKKTITAIRDTGYM